MNLDGVHIEEHSQLLPFIVKNKIKNIMHVDSHLDIGYIKDSITKKMKKCDIENISVFEEEYILSNNEGYNIGNFLYAAIILIKLEKIFWIVPECIKYEDIKVLLLKNIRELPYIEESVYDDIQVINGCISTYIYNTNLIIIPFENLKDYSLDCEVFLDIDIDFFINYYKGELWTTPKTLVETLKSNRNFEKVIGYSVCKSIYSGYACIQFEFLNDYLRSLFEDKISDRYEYIYMKKRKLNINELIDLNSKSYSNQYTEEEINLSNILFLNNLKSNFYDDKIEKLIDRIPILNKKSLFSIGQYFHKRGDLGKATYYYDRVQELNYRYKGIDLNLLRIYYANKKYNMVTNILKKYMDDESFEINYYKALIELNNKNYKMAEAIMLSNMKMYKINYKVYGNLIKLYSQTKDYTKLKWAINKYNKFK